MVPFADELKLKLKLGLNRRRVDLTPSPGGRGFTTIFYSPRDSKQSRGPLSYCHRLYSQHGTLA